MEKEDLPDKELEEELDKTFKASEDKQDVFSTIRKEKESVEVKEKRIKDKFKP